MTKGQVLARIESPELLNEYERERAALDAMSAALARQEIEIRRQILHSRQQEELARVAIQAAERELKRALAHVKRYGTQAVLMFVDLDGFKAINDRYGHGAGDLLLKAVARELIGHVRASDIVGRIGGDEFGVLLWRLEGPQATAKARQLEAMIAQVGIPHGRVRIEVAASIGVAPLVEDASPADIIAAADQAMYARKDERRGLPAPVRWGE